MAGREDSGTDADSTGDTVVVAAEGTLLLEAVDEKRNHTFTYRIEATQVQKASAYFERLLDPNKFGEGVTVADQLTKLKEKYGNISDVPVEELPRVKVSDVGRTSKVSSVKLLLRDFLRVLHGHDITAASGVSPVASAMPLANVANLAVVADRFDALPHTVAYVRRKRILETIDARSKTKATKVPEERLRQRLLVGMLFDHAPWVMTASQALIINGSVRWKQDAKPDDDLPLWWDMPRSLEDELVARRDYVVDALQSMALHFLSIYSSGVQQCKLGYANSWICDSFQLGEMSKFLRKNDLIKFGPVLTGQDEVESYAGDLERILDVYKSCPTWRMDEFHNHCGLRTRLVPLIEQVELYLRATSPFGVGICADCWKAHRSKYTWNKAKRPVGWRAPVPRVTASVARSPGSEACLQSHSTLRDMFMAIDRDWTPKEDRTEGLRFGRTTPYLKYD